MKRALLIITVANNEKLVFVFISNGDAVDDHKPIEEMMASALLGFPGGPTLEQLGPKAPQPPPATPPK